jgi:hypothetical protein
MRSRHSRHDFADRREEDPSHKIAIQTIGQEGKRVFGRPFVTAGWIVVGVSGAVAVVEIGLLALVLKFDNTSDR